MSLFACLQCRRYSREQWLADEGQCPCGGAIAEITSPGQLALLAGYWAKSQRSKPKRVRGFMLARHEKAVKILRAVRGHDENAAGLPREPREFRGQANPSILRARKILVRTVMGPALAIWCLWGCGLLLPATLSVASTGRPNWQLGVSVLLVNAAFGFLIWSWPFGKRKEKNRQERAE